MKNTAILLFTFFCVFTLSAQTTQASFLSDKKELQQIHPEALILTELNRVDGTHVVQIGDYNLATIESQNMQVNQIGDYQLLYYNETSKLQPSNLNVNMEGANNYIEIYGNNSIMENMSINVQGNDRSVIIRNY